MIGTFKSKALHDFWNKDDASGINPKWLARVTRILDALEVASDPGQLNMPGLHSLKGDRKGTYAVTVTRNWRITFAWSRERALDVNLEDYHG
jgi:proteic killer suppression protein